MERNEIDWDPVVKWFGHVPRFHDSEVISIELYRDPIPSIIRLHAFRMNADTDEHGHYRLDLHALVAFTFSGVEQLELEYWNHQNALMSLEIAKEGDMLRLDMEGAYGVHGFVIAKEISVKVDPWNGNSK
jgi:hypothetical protein